MNRVRKNGEEDEFRSLGRNWEPVVLGKQFQGLWLSKAYKGDTTRASEKGILFLATLVLRMMGTRVHVTRRITLMEKVQWLPPGPRLH